VKEDTIGVFPLIENAKAERHPGWCVYSEAFDSPEVEVLCGGVNSKTASAAAVWRQGCLLHFGFDLAPDEMNQRGRLFLVNCVAYVARFPEDRPIIHAPERALLRVGADRVVAKAEPEKGYVEWYFTAAVRKLGKADDWPAFQRWYKENRDYLRSEQKERGSLVLDDDAKAFGVPANKPDFLRTAVAALRESRERADLALKLLNRYAPDGPKGAEADAWQRWRAANEKYFFFSEAGWYRWYIDPLAKKRGVPTADLRGGKRASRQ
jgi:hypothetical protein